MNSDDLCSVVLTAPDADWLAEFTRTLVVDRLCAAVHLFPMRAIYRWEGEIHDVGEYRAECHTRNSLVPNIVERINSEHPYQVPGVVVLPLAGGGPDYLRWVRDETGDAVQDGSSWSP